MPFVAGTRNQPLGLLNVFNDGLHAAFYGHLPLAVGGAFSETACHGERLGTEGRRVPRFRERPVHIGVHSGGG